MKAFSTYFFIVLLGALSFSACSPFQLREPQFTGSFNELAGSDLFTLYEAGEEEAYQEFPDETNKMVSYWLNHFSNNKKGWQSMKTYLERSSRYLDFMGDILNEEGLPEDLIYVSMAESGFNPWAKSPKNAVGYWQFISSTGKNYGLSINRVMDERRDMELSTRAAAKYLKHLYNIFGNWHLSMAAYNCGEGKVISAIKKHNSKNFWHLANQKAIPKETREYVPKIIAMRKIALNPSDYGFHNLNWHKALEYELVSLSSSSSFSRIAERLNISKDELRRLNAKFNTDTIPYQGKKVYIRIPIPTDI